jgi:hypothetical protein
MRWVPSGGNVLGLSYSFLGEQGANNVAVFSSVPGSRTQGFAIKSDAFTGNLTLEDNFTAPEDTDDESLNELAETRLWEVTHPVSLNLTIPATPYFTKYNLRVNQIVPVTIIEGQLSIVGFYRIQTMTLTVDDYLELECIPAEVKGLRLV